MFNALLLGGMLALGTYFFSQLEPKWAKEARKKARTIKRVRTKKKRMRMISRKVRAEDRRRHDNASLELAFLVQRREMDARINARLAAHSPTVDTDRIPPVLNPTTLDTPTETP